MADYLKKARKLEKHREFLQAAEFYMLAGEHDHAIDIYAQERLYLKAAKTCERLGKVDRAVEFYSKIGDFNHAAELYKQTESWFQAGLMYKRAKRYREAGEMYEKSGVVSEAARMMEMEGDNVKAGDLYLQAGMFKSAAVCFQRAAEMASPLGDSFSIGKGLSENTVMRELYIKACRAWEKVPNIRKSAAIMEKLLEWKVAGGMYERCGDFPNALRCYDQADELDSAIELLKRLGQNEQATRLIAKRSEESGDHLSAAKHAEASGDLMLAADCYEKAGEFVRAAEIFERDMEFLHAAETYFRAENYPKAARMYELAGNNETAAGLYDDLGMIDKAIPLHIRGQNYIRAARLYLDNGEADEALRTLLRVQDNHPSIQTVRRLQSIGYFRIGKIDIGLEYARDVRDQLISNDNVEIHYEYARALQEDGQIKEAVVIYQQIVNFDKDYKSSREFLNWCAAMQEQITAEISDTIVGELPIGLVINNRYELLKLLGKGGMGIVYRAADRELNLAVALKILRPKFSYDPEFIEMIKREVTLARMLSHPNIIKIYDLNRAGHLWFVSMEFLEGEELKTMIQREGPLSLPFIVKLSRQVLSALEHSHQNRVFHSDIKPHNIFMDNQDRVTLVDFGIARAMGSHVDDGMVHGTPEYVSPEQIQGQPGTAVSDLYSFGVTLYEMVTGKMLFTGENLDEVLDKQLGMTPQPLNEIIPDVPEWLNRITMNLLNKNPANRFQSASEVLTEFPASI